MNLSIQTLSEAELRTVVGGEFIGLGGRPYSGRFAKLLI